MLLIRDVLRAIQRRPFIIIFFGAVTLVYSILSYFNPLSSLLLGFGSLSGGGIFEGILSLIPLVMNLLSDPKIFLISILAFIGTLILLSAIITLVLSGYFYILNNTIDGKPKFKGEFVIGLKRFYVKFYIMVLKTLFFTALLIIFMLIATIPAIVVTRTLISGRTEFFVMSILFIVITAAVLFLGFMFYSIYVSYWYPAALAYKKGAFIAGKRIANLFFWDIFKVFFIFDVIYAIFQFIYLFIGYSLSAQSTTNSAGTIILTIVNWIFKTVFYQIFLYYVFSSFKKYKETAKQEAETLA